MLFEQIRSGGCLSYLIGDDETCAGMVVDPHLDQLDRYAALAAERGMRIHYVAETHTHADHFSAARELARQLGARVVMHRLSAAPFVDVRVDDGESLVVGKLRVRVLHTPGHTEDSTCLVFADRVLTGDTLLIGGTGRTDLPTGDPDRLYDSLFGKLLRLDDALKVYPAHDYKDRASTTIGAEKASNPRLQKDKRADFVALMKGLDLKMPDHLSEALRTNRSGGKTVTQLLAEASREIAFVAMDEVAARLGKGEFVLLDVREREAFDAGHLPGARHLPRGQLELRVDKELPDPTARILTYCQLGKISTLAAATLRAMGYTRAVALDGGYEAWTTAGYPIEARR
ncbi:MAG TPA: rhodanese-like domain-containing protein [Kofleriaceae bacterium]|nr:rhodanese-like domain-containing protein [Kofleriaceae bacterium]